MSGYRGGGSRHAYLALVQEKVSSSQPAGINSDGRVEFKPVNGKGFGTHLFLNTTTMDNKESNFTRVHRLGK